MGRRRGHGLGWAALAALGVLTTAERAEGQTVPALREHRWKQRVLVVLAPDSTLPAYRTQMAELARHRTSLAERDVHVLPALAHEAQSRTLRRQLAVPAGEFRVVLVGKDGMPKLRRRAPLAVDELLQTIDGMPMGAAEARRRGGR
jgi:hypothetical protein